MPPIPVPVPAPLRKIKLKVPATANMAATGGGSSPTVHPPGARADADVPPLATASSRFAQAARFPARAATPPSSVAAGAVEFNSGGRVEEALLMPPPPRPVMMPPPAAVDSPSTLEALVEAADKRRCEGTHLAEAERLYRQALLGL